MPYLNAVTFWDRKNTAHDVGQLGVTELLLKLEEIVNTANDIPKFDLIKASDLLNTIRTIQYREKQKAKEAAKKKTP